MDTGFLRKLSVQDLLSLAAAVIAELGDRTGELVPQTSGRALAQPLLRPNHCIVVTLVLSVVLLALRARRTTGITSAGLIEGR